MTGVGWAALGTGAVAIVALAAALVVALRMVGLKDTIGDLRVEAKADDFEIRQLTNERELATTELAEVRGRYEREVADLIADLEVCAGRAEDMTPDQLRAELTRITTPRKP